MKRVVFAVLMLCVFTVGASAQATSGRLSGTVSGPDGILPGASVVVKDNSSDKELTQVANDNGGFLFPQLEVGTYTVTVKAANFKTFVATDLKIDVGREYSLNPTLEIGGFAETVTVVAGADIINATSAQLSTTVSPKQIRELPLIARNPLNLINLQAGATPVAGPFQQTSINGMRTTMTNITRDGINIQDAFIRTNATDFAPGRPSVDDTGEFTISTGNSDSDTGYGGAQVRLVTPRGESKFHGALFEYNRNSAVAANSFFNNRAGSFGPNDATVIQGRANAGDPRIPRPFRNRNQFGGTISGPAILPRFGEGGASIVKNKSFFFFSYEELRDPVSTLSTRTILTPGARTGQFQFNRATAGAASSICPGTAVGSLCTVPNILTFARSLGGTFLTVPGTIDSVVQSRILNDLPSIGNRTDLGDQLNTTGFAVNRQSSQFRKQYSTRFDWDVNQTNQINFIWSWNKENNLRPDADNNPIVTGYSVVPFSDQSSENRQLTLAYRTSLTSNFINEVRGGFFKSDVPFNRLVPVPAFFVTPPSTTGAAFAGVAGTTPFINAPETQFRDQGRNTAGYNIQDNADFIHGDHAFKFGGVFQFFQVDSFNDALISPTYTLGVGAATPQFSTANFASLGGISTAQLGTANALLSLLGGVLNGGSQGFNTESRTSGFKPTRLFQPFRYDNHALYVQDRWRVTPSLSLTLGLRYEYFPALRLDSGLALEPTIPAGVDPITAILDRNGTYSFVGTNAGKENAYYKTDKNNFAPSVGFAWSPSFKNKLLGSLFGEGRTTIRGGYSSVYGNDSIVTSINNAAVGNQGLGRTNGSALLGTSASINDRLQDGVTAITPPTFVTPPRTYIFNNAPANGGNNFGTVFAVDPNIQIPRIDQFSFGIQREVGFQTAVEVRYVGTRSNNLARSIDYNQVNIFSNGFLADFERARANLALTGNAFCVTAGCQALTIFQSGAGSAGHLGVGTGGLSATTFTNNLNNGTPAELAFQFISNGFNNHPTVTNPTASPFVNLIANPATGVANLFQNGGFYKYHSLQAEVRHRFSKGLYFQANYTFSKNLTNTIGTSQQLVEPFLDNNNKDLDKARADYDVTHVFNLNSIYELPFGRGKTFFSGANGLADRIIGGWQVSTIVAWASGAPLTFIDSRGTLNRAGRSARQTVNTNLTNDQIRDLIGHFETPAGIFFINPSVIDSTTGRGANGFGSPAFSGQAFFNPGPGTTGNMARAVVSGPSYLNLDASLIKNIRIREGWRFQIRAEAFNLLNNVNFNPAAQILDVGSATFGRLTQATPARVVQFAGRFEF